MAEERLLTLKEAANYLSVSVITVRRLVKAKAITSVKIGGQLRFRERDLIAYVERNVKRAVVSPARRVV